MALRQILLERYQIITTRVAPDKLQFSVFTWHKFDTTVPVVLVKTTEYFIDAVMWIVNDRGFGNTSRQGQFVNTLEELYICGSDVI